MPKLVLVIHWLEAPLMFVNAEPSPENAVARTVPLTSSALPGVREPMPTLPCTIRPPEGAAVETYVEFMPVPIPTPPITESLLAGATVPTPILPAIKVPLDV